ncbi:MAG: hypothetical protein E7295_08790 [Lachnospiraceae bacterium]|nr:hypothetical protein [Lachnospiraceae bacterium]
MFRIGICDVSARNILEEGVRRYFKRENLRCEITIWETIDEMMDALLAGKELEVLFLGIQSEGMLELESAKRIRDELREIQMRLIYVSNADSFSKELIQTMPFDALTNGFSIKDTETVMERAVSSFHREQEYFKFRFGKNYYSIPVDDILYLCSDVRRIRVKTRQQEYEFNGLLKEVKEKLPRRFLSIHRSFVINREHVMQFTSEMVRLTDGTILSISKPYRNLARACLRSKR